MWQAIYHEFQRWAKTPMRLLAAYRTTEITVEIDQRWVIRKPRAARVRCAECGRDVGTREPAILLAQPGRVNRVTSGAGGLLGEAVLLSREKTREPGAD